MEARASMISKEASYEIKVSAPSIPADAFNVVLNYNELNVFALSTGDKNTDSPNPFRVPLFLRSFALPNFVDPEGIEASYENGELRIFLPFSHKKDQLRRRIAIRRPK